MKFDLALNVQFNFVNLCEYLGQEKSIILYITYVNQFVRKKNILQTRYDFRCRMFWACFVNFLKEKS